MNCNKQYEYVVREVILVKVNTDTGEEVLNKDNTVKMFKPKDMSFYADAYYDDGEVEALLWQD